MLLARRGRIPPSDEAAAALRAVLNVELSKDDHLAAVRTAFFAPGNDPSVWFDGCYSAAAAQSAATRDTPVETWWTAGDIDVLAVQPADDVIAADCLAQSGEFADADVVYTSLLPRAQQTAAAIMEVAGSPPVRQSCDWCEIHPGVAEGLTWDEMRVRFPPSGNPDDPVVRRLPEMETWAEMFERVGQSLQAAVGGHAGGTVVAVTSGDRSEQASSRSGVPPTSRESFTRARR